jgi:hypothetical protein
MLVQPVGYHAPIERCNYARLNWWIVITVSAVGWLPACVRENVMCTGVQVSKQNNLAFLSQARISPANPHVQPHERSV